MSMPYYKVYDPIISWRTQYLGNFLTKKLRYWSLHWGKNITKINVIFNFISVFDSKLSHNKCKLLIRGRLEKKELKTLFTGTHFSNTKDPARWKLTKILSTKMYFVCIIARFTKFIKIAKPYRHHLRICRSVFCQHRPSRRTKSFSSTNCRRRTVRWTSKLDLRQNGIDPKRTVCRRRFDCDVPSDWEGCDKWNCPDDICRGSLFGRSGNL